MDPRAPAPGRRGRRRAPNACDVVHQNFPAQFQYIAPRLVRDRGWDCTFVTEKADGALPGVAKVVYKAVGGATAQNHPCTRNFENTVAHATASSTGAEGPARRPARPGRRPHRLRVVAVPPVPVRRADHQLPRALLPRHGAGPGYRPELPVTEIDLLRISAKNAMMLLDLENCDRGWTPTRCRATTSRRPTATRLRSSSTASIRRSTTAATTPTAGSASAYVGPGRKIVTYVARGFEMMRGFDIFMKAARRIYEQDPEVTFVVVGTDRVHYGNDLNYIPGDTFRHHVLAQERSRPLEVPVRRLRPPGHARRHPVLDQRPAHLPHPAVHRVLVDGQRDGLRGGRPGLRPGLRPRVHHAGRERPALRLLRRRGAGAQALEVLGDPATYRPLGEAARRTVEEKYSVPGGDVQGGGVLRAGRGPEARAERAGGAPGAAGDPDPGPARWTASGPRSPAAASPAGSPVPPAAAGGPPGGGGGGGGDAAMGGVRQLAGGRSRCPTDRGLSGGADRSSAPPGSGPPAHPTDLARLMQRVAEWNVQLALDLGTRGGDAVPVDPRRVRPARPSRPGCRGGPTRRGWSRDSAMAGAAGRRVHPGADDPEELARRVDRACEGRPAGLPLHGRAAPHGAPRGLPPLPPAGAARTGWSPGTASR